jgi:hypothetical protein
LPRPDKNGLSGFISMPIDSHNPFEKGIAKNIALQTVKTVYAVPLLEIKDLYHENNKTKTHKKSNRTARYWTINKETSKQKSV